MQILKADLSRFTSIPDFDFAENWIEIDLGNGQMANMHYLDEGPQDAPPVLLFHGCLLYTSPSPRDQRGSRMPSSA